MPKNNNPYDQFVNIDYSSLSDWVFSFTGNEFAAIGTIIGVVIASQLNLNQQNALGNFFELIGQTLLTIYSQDYNIKTRIFNNQQFNQDTYNKINTLEQEIIRLKNEINKLKK